MFSFSVPPYMNKWSYESLNAPARIKAALSLSLALLVVIAITQGIKHIIIYGYGWPNYGPRGNCGPLLSFMRQP